MTQRGFVAILTVVVFVAGYATRAMTVRSQAVPPPPAALANEFAVARATDGKNKQAVDRAKVIADIEKLRPEIEVYRRRVDEIYAEFDRELIKILTPAQQEKYVATQKRWADRISKWKADSKPLTDDDILRARERPLTDIYWMVTVNPRLERLTKEYELDAAQQTAARAQLNLRRDKFIALLDGTQHPSIKLSQLAPMIDRVAPHPHPAK
jgi:hypothetical protein